MVQSLNFNSTASDVSLTFTEPLLGIRQHWQIFSRHSAGGNRFAPDNVVRWSWRRRHGNGTDDVTHGSTVLGVHCRLNKLQTQSIINKQDVRPRWSTRYAMLRLRSSARDLVNDQMTSEAYHRYLEINTLTKLQVYVAVFYIYTNCFIFILGVNRLMG